MWDFGTGRMTIVVPKILPAVYEDAMTYYEQLKILNGKLNEVIAVFNSYGQEMLDSAMQYTDERIRLAEERFNQQLNEMQVQLGQGLADMEERLTKAITDFEAEADEEFANFRAEAERLFQWFRDVTEEFNSIINRLQNDIAILFALQAANKMETRQLINDKFKALTTYIDGILAAKSGNTIIVSNPYRRTLTTLNVALKDLYNITYSLFSLTADQYRSLSLTADEYRDLNLTAAAYVYEGRLRFFEEIYFPNINERFATLYGYVNAAVERLDKNHYMISPFDGRWVPAQLVINKLANLHKDSITADQYKSGLFTVDKYKEIGITAHDYAWNGYYLLFTGAVPKETLEEKIREMQKTMANMQQEIDQLKNDSVESTVIADMKADITQQKKTAEAQQNMLISVSARVQQQSKAIMEINTDLDDIDSNITTLDNKTADNAAKISGVTQGLESIHINYTKK